MIIDALCEPERLVGASAGLTPAVSQQSRACLKGAHGRSTRARSVAPLPSPVARPRVARRPPPS